MPWITSEEALALLKVQPQTLYANVSRGRIRTRPHPQDVRRSLYHGEDVKRLAGRHAGRRSVADVAAQTISFGEPVLASGLSTIADGRLWYRGEDTVRLSEQAGLEEIARLLWQVGKVDLAFPPTVKGTPIPTNPFEAALLALARRASHDFPTGGRSHAVLCREAAGLVGTMAAAMLGGGSDGTLPLHQQAALAWQAPDAADLIRRALVLLADHELNASTFAARTAASTGAPLAAGLLAGLGTLAGPLHGTAAVSVQALAETARRIGARRAVHDWLSRGHRLPAFGHPLYPDGDPRATALLACFSCSEIYEGIREAVAEHSDEPPNVDFALAALADRHGLPASAPFTLFALARSVGWIAHMLEQTARGSLIRPRAHYDGPPLNMAAAVETA
ncbi:citrate synthase [Labrys neptuniae]|uniref:citrate synthase (unknown stereospecificity) n=1 Tax=Labrys neptuniae TaxID=376174 RepID=A0ABV3PIY4_9HYPH